jgi:hypothetical protein
MAGREFLREDAVISRIDTMEDGVPGTVEDIPTSTP